MAAMAAAFGNTKAVLMARFGKITLADIAK